MRKRLIAKGNVHKNDYLRALVTDTLPGDVPIIISNDGFYRNMQPAASVNREQQEFVARVLDVEVKFTIPYRYDIMRSGGLPRRLSLMHPSGQLGVVELYRNYADLICYYCRKSNASLRSPRKVGSLFFVRGFASDKNKVKRQGIDTVNLETTVSNPASYFSYKGVDRAFRFFQSTAFVRLEKRYTVMHFTDVSKCFHSIYTHTLFWALADIQTAKENTQAVAFGNVFDRLMQSVNYNETNGICVGAEVSRIFAELILSEVDRRIVLRLQEQGFLFSVHYEFRRYVDDFYVFSQDENVARTVLLVIESCLSEFNLHLNEMKTIKVPRPFITTKSKMVRDVNGALEEFFAKFIGTGREEGMSYAYPLRIRRPQALLRTLLDSIKAGCFDNQSGYSETSNYVIGALNTRVSSLIDGYHMSQRNNIAENEQYVSAIFLLLDAIYFIYSVDPTVASSLRVAQAAILSFQFFQKNIPERAPFFAEQIVRWTFEFIDEMHINPALKENSCIPLESINALLVLGEVGRGNVLARQAISDFCSREKPLGYFEIVSYLFCLGNDPNFDQLRSLLFNQACALLREQGELQIQSQSAHLALDILSCPHIPKDKRANLFNELRSGIGLAKIPRAGAIEAVKAFENSPWFVDWNGTRLLAMIRKKELSAVY